MSNPRTNQYNLNNVIGTDPITKGIFTIEYAFVVYDDYSDYAEYCDKIPNYQGKIVIPFGNNNPLFKIAKEEPLRLQGLISSVNFGMDKRFIKIRTIADYEFLKDYTNSVNDKITLNTVIFEILDNLKYLEEIDSYKNWNLL